MAVTLYGISNCDTMKKARKWLDERGIEYRFHDYRKLGLEERQLRVWVEELGWEALLNRRGMMWRKLDQQVRDGIDEASAMRVMLETPAIIKRPLLEVSDRYYLGFSDKSYGEIFPHD